jgi:hypothetical protein
MFCSEEDRIMIRTIVTERTLLWLAVGILLCLSAGILPAQAPRATPLRRNVAEAGAVGDGKTDNTAVFQQLLDEAGRSGGGIVEVPAGRYRIQGTLRIPAGVTLQGTYRVPPTIRQETLSTPDGSLLLAYAGRNAPESPAFITLAGNNAALIGVVVAYPEWKQTDVPPIPYPPTVYSQDTENVAVQDCGFLNVYEAIKLIRAHRHLVRNVTGYPSKRGLFVDECYDIGHIENIHFWPFGVAYNPEDPYCLWVNTQGVAFELARTDWHYVSNTFCFGYGVGYKFSESKAGSTNGNFLGLGADSCRRAVLVEQAQPPGLLITNGEFVGRWSSTDSVCLEIGPNVEGKVSLSNCSFWGPIDRCVWMRSPSSQFTATACHFVNWDNHRKGAPAIQLDAGKAIVQGCTFAEEGTHVLVETKVLSALLTGNQATGGFRVENRAGKRTQTAANETDSIEWTPEALSHYRITLGAEGDGRYLRQWHGRERIPAGNGNFRTMRWSTTGALLRLPTLPGKAYTLTLELNMPQAAAHAEAGLYVEGKRVAILQPGAQIVTAELPPSRADRIQVEIRCQGWVPRKVITGSGDDRTLGISGYTVRMRRRGAPERCFSANTGEWLP